MTKLWGQACHAEGPPPTVRPGLLCTGAPVCGLLGSGQGTGQGHPAGRDGGRDGGGAVCTLLLYMAPPSGPASSLRWTSRLQAWPWLFCPLGRCFSTVAGAAAAAPPAGSLRPLPGRRQCPQTTQPLR